MFKKFVLTVSMGAVLAALTTSTASAHAIDSYGNSDPRHDTATVAPFGTVTYRPILFGSNDDGIVWITGDGATLLDVSIYDERGNLINHYAGNSPWISFRPYWAQGMVIRVRNLGAYSNTFSMRTN